VTIPVGVPPEPGVWVHEGVEIRESPIEGRGLFSLVPMVSGTLVLRLGGHIVSSVELGVLISTANTDPDVTYVDTISLAEDRHLVLPPSTMVHFGNHSCDPSLWHSGLYDLTARRPIAPGDEITVDYGTQSALPSFRMTCSCGSSSCRGEVSGDDWRRDDLRERYRGHWVPVLEDRISRP
jgi:uncharacterized protein